MPQEQFFDIVGDTKKSEYSEFDASLTVNMFQVNEPDSFYKKALFPTPGLNLDTGQIFDIGSTGEEGRALYLFKNRIYAVVKDTIFVIEGSITDGNLILSHSILGTIETESGYVGIAELNNQLIFVDGTGGWVYNEGTGDFITITDAAFPSSPTDITVLANRAIVNDRDTKTSYFSAFGDALTWTQPGIGNFFDMNVYSDVVIGYQTINGKMFIFGNTHTEVWYDAGAPSLPYRPQNPTLEIGCAAVGSIAKAFGFLVWLSRTDRGIGSIVVSDGGLPIPISTDAINREIDSYDNVTDATSFLYRNEIGHIVYVINFTSADASWMYDFNTKGWSKLESDDRNRYLANAYIYYKSRHFVLDYKQPYLYEMSQKFHDDNGKAILRMRIFNIDKITIKIEHYNKTPFVLLGAEGNITKVNFFKIILNRIRFYLKQGTGTATGMDANPVLFISTSIDGGISYRNKLEAHIGQMGKRVFETDFLNIGGLST